MQRTQEYKNIRLRILLLFAVCWLLCVIFGCQPGNQNMVVKIDADGHFPQTMVGTWRTGGKTPWEMTFRDDGAIVSALARPGAVEMVPGKVKKFDVKYGGKGVFEPGLWMVEVVTNQITVTLELQSFYQDMGKDAIEGDSIDVFVGNISADGREWVVDWFSSGRYVALLGKGPLGGRKVLERVEFSNVVEPDYRETLTFKKIDD